MADLEVHLLDPGAIEYGDCVLCVADGKSILIDGGKKASATETTDTVLGRTVVHAPIQDQIEAILGSIAVDLLIVTHCHSDHVGRLPKLIADGVITCEWALIADPQLGFGIGGDSGPLPRADQMNAAEKLWLALREEPFHSSSDAEVLQFIEDAAGEYQDYVDMVELLERALSRRGGLVVRYKGEDSMGLDPLLLMFQETGLKILGPSLRQLGNCAKFLVGRSEDVADMQSQLTAEGRVDLAAAYRNALRAAATSAADAADSEDTPENGNAVNNQSIVLSIGHGPARALLTADMQFARPQLSDDGVKQEMQALRKLIAGDVAENGPFGFLKLSHHGAANGHDATLLKEWGAGLFGISTGSASTKHPTEPTLAALKALKDANSGVQWGRTDLNGRVTYKVTGDRRVLLKERGRWNDLTPPARRAGDAGPSEPAVAETLAAPIQPTIRMAEGNVEVTLKFPFGKGKVRVTIETDPEGSTSPLS